MLSISLVFLICIVAYFRIQNQNIRHPAYAGMIIAYFGIVLYFCNLVTLLIFFLALIPAILLRIFVEEKTLFTIKGYSNYAESRKRLTPLIW